MRSHVFLVALLVGAAFGGVLTALPAASACADPMDGPAPCAPHCVGSFCLGGCIRVCPMSSPVSSCVWVVPQGGDAGDQVCANASDLSCAVAWKHETFLGTTTYCVGA